MWFKCLLSLIISVIGSHSFRYFNPNACRYTPTTVSGTQAPSGRICKDQLLLEETFDSFNTDLWKHEMTLGGGGVSLHLFHINSMHLINLKYIFRIGNFNGTQMIRKIHLLKMVIYTFVQH